MTILLRCRTCKGTGEIPNKEFQICQELKSHDTKKYFHIPTEDEIVNHDSNEPNGCNKIPEKIPCPTCNGEGVLELDEEDWDIRIVADEDDLAEE